MILYAPVSCRCFFHALLSIFQNYLLAQLTARIKTLEDAGSLSDVPARLSRIIQYSFRREEEFDKYDALAMEEQLATAAKLSGHEKAPTFDTIACTLGRSCLSQRKKFKAYFVALFFNRDSNAYHKNATKLCKSACGLHGGLFSEWTADQPPVWIRYRNNFF